MQSLPQLVYRADEVEFYPVQGRLLRAGREVHLRQKSLRVLVYLIERRDRIVTKEELLDNLWPATAVTDGVLTQCIIDIRKALDEDSRSPRFIKNIPRVGYRFIHPLEEICLSGAVDSLSLVAEETTSVEIEYTETITPAPALAGEGVATPEKSGLLSSRKRKLIAALGLSILMAAAVYLSFRLMTSARLAAEIVPPPAPGKKLVLVMPFDDHSNNPELAWMREGLPDMLITNLSRSNHLNVISRQQIHLLLERVNHERGASVRFDEALEVARRSHAEAFMLGGFSALDREIRISAQLYETETGRMLAAEQIAVDDQNLVLTHVNLLTMKLAAHLVAGRDATTQPAAFGTTDLEAFRYYSLGLGKAMGFENDEAIALLKKAIELDPQFAMAYARIGYTYALAWGLYDEARPYLEKAFALSDRLTDKDRLNIAAWYAVANADYDGAIRAFREVIKHYPMEGDAYHRLARLLQGEGRFDEYLEVTKQGLVIDPESKDLYNLLGFAHFEFGDYDQAIAAHQKYVQLAPKEPNAYDSLGLIYHAMGRYEDAIATYERGLEIDPEFDIAVFHLANSYAHVGRYKDALRLYERYVRLAQSAGEQSLGYRAMARIHLYLGNRARAEALAATESRVTKNRGTATFVLAVERGEFQSAERMLEKLRPGLIIARGQRGYLRHIYWMEGCLALKRGQAADAIENFREALRQRSMSWDMDSFDDCLANAYLHTGQYDDAISEYERVLRINPRYPLAHYRLAHAYERKGDDAQARAAYEQFLEVWKEADPDIPEVIEAKRWLAQWLSPGA